MAYCCCVCRENLASEKKKKGEQVVTKPLVTTKCGHLYHTECLKKAFTSSGNDVWATKDCPVCKMTLTIATDLIRIFPSASSVDEDGPSIEELVECIKKYESQTLELRNLLESSFLRNREAEKAINQLKKENEKLNENQKQLIESKSEDKTIIKSLTFENVQLRNTVVSLSNNITQMNSAQQFNRMNMNPFGFRPPGPGLLPHKMRFSPPPPPFYPNLPYPIMRNGLPINGVHGPMNATTRAPWPNSGENIQSLSQKFSRTVSLNHLNNLNESQISLIEKNKHNNTEEKITNNSSVQEYENKEINKPLEVPNTKIEAGSNSFVDEFMDDLLKDDDHTTNSSRPIYANRFENNNSVMDNNGFLPIRPIDTDLEDSKTPYQGMKQVYGKYACESCQAVWGSSQSYANRPQICRNCNIPVFPYAQCPLASKKKTLAL